MILVIGSGVAGLSCALAAVRAAAALGADIEVELVSANEIDAGEFDACNTRLAQGGIAAAVAPDDSAAAHLADTLAAGAGLVDREAASLLVRDGAEQVRAMLSAGFAADRGPDGATLFGLEAAHSAARIVHGGGDRTGAVLHDYLLGLAREASREGRLTLRCGSRAVTLLEEAGQVTGAVLRGGAGSAAGAGAANRDTGDSLTVRRADAVVLATGGYAALFPRTSNHVGATGEGIVAAARAGAAIADLEFVQFHPTVLHGTGQLISEAVRGAGAVLRDGGGRRFMLERSPLAELAPRDVVSREIHRRLKETGEESVWLDATGIEAEGGPGTLRCRFPGISAAVAARGLDWAREPIAVSPAAHYTMGGVMSDLDGRTTVPGLFVAGEASSTGVHGANRLASNSLLEGLVFGARSGAAAVQFARGVGDARAWKLRGQGVAALGESTGAATVLSAGLPHVQPYGLRAELDAADKTDKTDNADRAVAAAVSSGLGIERDAERLAAASAVFGQASGPAAALAGMVAHAAAQRTESRGSHQRADFPETDQAQAERRAYRFVPGRAPQPSELISDRRSLASC